MNKMIQIAALLLFFMMAVGAAGAEVIFSPPPADWEPEGTLAWTIFDVNEGDCMLLTCDGESMMVDGGPQPFRAELRDALIERRLQHMKYYLSTHYHDDHIRGLYFQLLYGLTCDEYLHPYAGSALTRNEEMKKIIAAVNKRGIPHRRLQNGDSLTLGGADIQVFRCTSIKNENAQSLVLKVTYKNSSILLPADIIGDAQKEYVKHYPDVLKADLLKMPHHAITPAVPAFLELVDPDAAIITNTPTRLEKAPVSQLKRYNIPTLYSGEGTVYAITDGETWYIYQTKGDF